MTLEGLNIQLDSVGRPEHAKVTVGLKPTNGAGVTVTFVCALCPRVTVRLDGAGVIDKSTTINATSDDEEPAKLVSPL